MTDIYIRTLLRVDRLPNSELGNPRYDFTFTDGSRHRSIANAGFCYAVGNVGLRAGDEVLLTLTACGRVRNMVSTGRVGLL